MKKLIIPSFLLLLAPTLGHATQYEFTNSNEITLITLSDASGLVISSGLSLQLGAFSAGFTPTSDNTGEWRDHWLTSGAPGYVDTSGVWSTSLILSDQSIITSGSQLYLWAYDQRDLSAGDAGWLLLTSTNWTAVASYLEDSVVRSFYFPFYADTALRDYTDPISAILGNFNLGAGTAQLADVSGSPVPEPATWAAIFGVCTLGFALWRRRSVAGS
ncbi:exosortase [Opitutaceae bacterium TAV5]|nr:exosortase [Opitutaceae bacterium TAV5]